MEENAILFSYDTRVNFTVFWSILGIAFFVFVAYLVVRRFKINWQQFFTIVLIEYVISVLLLTVVFRETPVYPEGFQNSLLVDKTILSGNLLAERIVNVGLFLPIGFLLCSLIKEYRLVVTITSGVTISIIIELLQHMLNKGVADVDDIFCNSIGLTIGAIISVLLIKR